MRYGIVLVLFCLLVALMFRVSKPLPELNDDLRFLPKAEYVGYLSLGQKVTASSLIWIQGVIKLGESNLTGKEFNYLGYMADISTQLDSLFYTPYYFIGGVVPISATDTSDFPVMRRATRVYPEDWRLALYFAIRLANGPTHNNAEAATLMARYAESPDTTMPPYIRTIHETFALGAMQTEIALTTILEDSMNPQYQAFRGNLIAKTLRVLGHYTLSPKDPDREAISEIINNVIDRKLDPNIAYRQLLAMKKEPNS
ncbi:MAG: hypothetical protein LBR60_00240 [Fibrobacter sp.]|jgi:hypothetical protein|nr:hypothetical protein [Fibrobacter sp.]